MASIIVFQEVHVLFVHSIVPIEIDLMEKTHLVNKSITEKVLL